VIIEDRIGKAVEAFTYGGSLEIDTNEERTLCTLVSPASILDLSAEDDSLTRLPVTHLLAQETEILLAERRAAWAHNPEQYDRRLAGSDPASLYAACLQAILEKYRRFPTAGDDLTRRFLQALKVENQIFDSSPAKRISDLL
jgi:hypothetical protein